MNKVKTQSFLPIFQFGDKLLKILLKKWYILIALIIILILLGSFIKTILILSIFYIIASLSLFYNRFIKISLGFEFISFTTIICARAYGPFIGIIIGALSLFSAEIIAGRFTGSTIISILGISIIGLAASYFTMHIAIAGIILCIVYDLIIAPLYVLTGSSPIKTIIFVITHLAWNAWLFITFGAPILQLITKTT